MSLLEALAITLALAEVLGCGQGGVVAYQAMPRQKVTRRRMGVRNRSATLYLALAKEISFCRLCMSSLGRRKGENAVSEQLVGSRKKRGRCKHGTLKGACFERQM